MTFSVSYCLRDTRTNGMYICVFVCMYECMLNDLPEDKFEDRKVQEKKITIKKNWHKNGVLQKA